MKEEPDDIIDGDLTHLSWNYPNTGAGKGEISDEQWINSRPCLNTDCACWNDTDYDELTKERTGHCGLINI